MVAEEIAAALGAPLDVIVVRKLRAPDDPELAIGALVAALPDVVLDEGAIERLKVSPDDVRDEITAQLAEARLREALLREGGRPVSLAGRTAIVVDDGIATGNTMNVALRGYAGCVRGVSFLRYRSWRWMCSRRSGRSWTRSCVCRFRAASMPSEHLPGVRADLRWRGVRAARARARARGVRRSGGSGRGRAPRQPLKHLELFA